MLNVGGFYHIAPERCMNKEAGISIFEELKLFLEYLVYIVPC